MRRQSHGRVFLNQLVGDWGVFGSFVVGIILLAAEIAAPQGWKLGLRSVAMALLIAGFISSLYKNYRTSLLVQRDKPVPLLFAVEMPRREALRILDLSKEAITRHTRFDAFRKVENMFNVHYDDLLAHREERLPPDTAVWHDFLESKQQQFQQFLQHVPGERIYQVFIRGPASLGLGIGAVLGTLNRVVAYHFINGRYEPVLDLSHDPRRVKISTLGQTFKYIEVTFPEMLQGDIAVVLDMAGHIASGDVQDYLASWSQSIPLVVVSNTYGGNLTVSDWVPVVQELYQVFHKLQGDSRVGHIHLFHSIPGPLAVGLGMALGTFVPITVYNWERDQGTYHPVLQLNQLRGLL